jgi:hypothetical protein
LIESEGELGSDEGVGGKGGTVRFVGGEEVVHGEEHAEFVFLAAC